MCGYRRWYNKSVLDFQITAPSQPPALTNLTLCSERTRDGCGLCKCDIYLHECSDEEWIRTATVMSDLSHLSSQVKINDTKYQPPYMIYIYSTFLLPQTQTYRRPFPQPDCFSFSKYTANNNNREPLAKSQAMKNAEMTSTGQAICRERLRQDILSLGTL